MKIREENCLFCQKSGLKNENWYADWDPTPVNVGHIKIMPVRHDAGLFDLTDKEKVDFWELLERVKRHLDKAFGDKYKPDGYNIGINIGEAAGQTIEHLHVHIIPRYKGDVENPRGGIRNFMKSKVEW